MGFFGNLDVEAYDRKYTDRQLVMRMVEYYRPYMRALTLITGMMLVSAVTGALSPYVVSKGVDVIRQNPTTWNVVLMFLAVMATGVVSWLANLFRRRLTVRTIGTVELNMRQTAFRAAMEHDLSFYDEISSGRVVSRVTSDTREFSNIVILVTDLISQIFQAVLLGFVLVRIEWQLSLIVFAFIPVLFLSAVAFRRLARQVTRHGMRAMANVNAAIKETVSGIAVAKNFRKETVIFEEFDTANKQSYRVNIKRGFVLGMVFPTLSVLGGVGTGILVYFGGLTAAQGIVTAGAWYLFLQSLDRFFFPVMNLSSFWAQVQSGLSAAERVFSLIDAESTVTQTDSKRVRTMRGEIQFVNVHFRYNEQQKVLIDFNLHIKPGENIALVGHTGAGKSSIARLLARFYEFQEGIILVDGQDIRSFDLTSYRSQLGIVSQSPFLFSGTVAENICYACPTSATIKEVEQLASQIGSGDWLETFQQGLLTEVGERGARLSMGQRQLVSLMRVLVQRPSIFILDEATASIDPFTEWHIQQALRLVLAKTTSILIAHRLSTVKAADRIIVLENGRIIEEGNHEGLIAQGGNYASLYNTYFRHQSIDYKPEGIDQYLQERKSLQVKLD